MAQQLRVRGIDASILQGGYAAWRAAFPLDANGTNGVAPESHVIPLDQITVTQPKRTDTTAAS